MLSTRLNKNLSLFCIDTKCGLILECKFITLQLWVLFILQTVPRLSFLCCLSLLCCASGTYKSNYFAIGFVKYRPVWYECSFKNNQKPQATPRGILECHFCFFEFSCLCSSIHSGRQLVFLTFQQSLVRIHFSCKNVYVVVCTKYKCWHG